MYIELNLMDVVGVDISKEALAISRRD